MSKVIFFHISKTILDSLFNIGKSASFHGHTVEEKVQPTLTHSTSAVSSVTGRAKFEKIRSGLKGISAFFNV